MNVERFKKYCQHCEYKEVPADVDPCAKCKFNVLLTNNFKLASRSSNPFPPIGSRAWGWYEDNRVWKTKLSNRYVVSVLALDALVQCVPGRTELGRYLYVKDALRLVELRIRREWRTKGIKPLVEKGPANV